MLGSLKHPLQTVIRVLDNSGYRYAVIGGIAVSEWGIARTTIDIDIKVLVIESDYEKIREILISNFPTAARQNAPKERLILSVKIDEVIVDFIFTVPGYDELIVHRANKREIDGITAWICSAEDLVIQKMIAGRVKDYLDVQTVLDVQKGKLDYDYIEDWLRQFASLLDAPEILTNYNEMIAKTNQTPGI